MFLLVVFRDLFVRLGRSFKWQEFSQWIVLLQPERDEMSPNELPGVVAEQRCLLGIWRSHKCRMPCPPYEVVAVKHLRC